MSSKPKKTVRYFYPSKNASAPKKEEFKATEKQEETEKTMDDDKKEKKTTGKAKEKQLPAARVVSGCHASELQSLLKETAVDGYEMVVTHITHPHCCLNIQELVKKAHDMSGGAGENTSMRIVDELLPDIEVPITALEERGDWTKSVIGCLADWIDPDSEDPYIRLFSKKAMEQAFAQFHRLNLTAAVIRLKGPDNLQLAGILAQEVAKHRTRGYDYGFKWIKRTFNIWVNVPIIDPPKRKNKIDPATDCVDETDNCGGMKNDPATVALDINGAASTESLSTKSKNAQCSAEEEEAEDTWHWFYRIRSACDNHPRIRLCLELGPEVPKMPDPPKKEEMQSPVVVKRWLGEPIVAIMLDTRTFTNPSSPVLSTDHLRLIRNLFALDLHCLIGGPTKRARHNPEKHPNLPACLYFSYVNNTLWKNREQLTWLQRRSRTCLDVLYPPMHPLVELLPSWTYANFESDSKKYERYKTAFTTALQHLMWTRGVDEANPVVVMVLGAGRGGLVQAGFEALKYCDVRHFKFFAIERNDSAIVTLTEKRATVWENRVEIVHTDMREWKPSEEDKADIVVSELLGSFGCNELSPECLDGALHLMKKTCISIPGSYKSYIGPIHSPKILVGLHYLTKIEKEPRDPYECHYVCRLCNVFQIDTPKKLFEFSHPNWTNQTNERDVELTFKATETCEMMGFAGFFRALLYGNTDISTYPAYETRGLDSWYPVVFPLKRTVYVKKDQTIRVRFWRCEDSARVWYEWQLLEPEIHPISNSYGRSHEITKY